MRAGVLRGVTCSGCSWLVCFGMVEPVARPAAKLTGAHITHSVIKGMVRRLGVYLPSAYIARLAFE